MANLRQDRVPDPTLAQSSAPGADANGRPPVPRTFVLTVLLRISDGSGAPAGVSSPADSPAAALASDILSGSGGAPETLRGAVLTARFSTLPSALLAVRRLNWALQGLAETSASPISAAAAIHSTDEEISEPVEPRLESLDPGTILLSAATVAAVQNVPGLALLGPAGQNWRQAQWVSVPANLAADEQTVAAQIRALGRDDPGAPPPQPTQTQPAAPTTGAFQPSASLGRSLEEPSSGPPLWKKPWALAGAGAAVLLLVAVLVIPFFTSRDRAKSPAPEPSTAAAPVPPSSAPRETAAPRPTTVEKPREPKPSPKSLRQPRNETVTESRADAKPKTETPVADKTEPPAAKPAPASCDFTEGEIPLSLQRAERLMYAGKLTEAQNAYQRLVGCPSAHDRATEGLRIVRQRIAAQSPSAPN